MPKDSEREAADDLRPEYDLRELTKSGVRGKYAERFRSGTNLALLDPDIARAFPDDAAVNQALRPVLQLAQLTQTPTPRPADSPTQEPAAAVA